MVGGPSEKTRKLRQAISIALDIEEQISIFANGRGIPANGPIAPGVSTVPAASSPPASVITTFGSAWPRM